jgi:hypothetical protein
MMVTTHFHSVSANPICDAKTLEKNEIVCPSVPDINWRLLEVPSEFQSTTEIIRILQEELISTWLIADKYPGTRTWPNTDEQTLTAAKPTAGFTYD